MPEPITPFAASAQSLTDLGFSVLPLIAHNAAHGGRGKAPGEFRGAWAGMTKWQRFRDQQPSSFEMNLWLKYPEANIGLAMGTSPRRDLHVISLDFDASDPDALDTLLRSAPASPMVKKGRKGETRFFLAPKTMKTRSYDGPDGRMLDLLTGFDTRQTVVPPSIHPETGQPYVWLSGPVAAADLPVFTDEDLQALEEALETCGWARGGRGPQQREARPAPVDADDIWSETKAAAMASLGSWVPALDLYGCRPARGGYEAVATWRASSSGQAIESRKLNLSINPTGIKDWGTGDTYSAIDLVMSARDCDQAEATTWLRGQLGLDDGAVVIELGAGTKGQTPSALKEADGVDGALTDDPKTNAAITSAESTSAPTHGVGELPAHLLDVPGLVGEIAAWMERISLTPLPVLNLAAALCVVGTAAARKWATPLDGGLHLYVLGLAPTGQGKELPRRAATHLLTAAGLSRMVAPSSFMSASALIQTVERNPACLSISDEVAEFFAKLNSKSATTHERAISGVMRELWGVNWGTYVPPGWANSRDRAQPLPIHAPAFSFFGLSVPQAVWQALTGSDVFNGFLNRFLVLTTAGGVEEREPQESIFDVPTALVDWVKEIAGHGGALTGATLHSDMPHAPLVRVPWDGGRDGEAAGIFRDLRAHCRDHPQCESLMKRTAEIALRLATIRAVGIGGVDAAVTVDDMAWGRDVALWSANRVIVDSHAHMSDTEWQAKAKFVLRCITESPGRAITRTALCRKVAHRFPARELDSLLKGLMESAEVADNSSRSGRRGPEILTYRAV